MSEKRRDIHTFCARVGIDERPNAPLAPSIHTASTFALGTADESDRLLSGESEGYLYTRYKNPTVEMLASAIADLEGGAAALATSSGNAATLTAIQMALRGRDDHLLIMRGIYGGSTELFGLLSGKFGLELTYGDPSTEIWLKQIQAATVVFVETPSNPLLQLVDLERTVTAAKKAGAKVIVDNTVATPYNQQPLAFGVDYVVHSLSKYLNGHSDLIAGCIVSREGFSDAEKTLHKALGGTMNAMDAFFALRGMRTFAVRMAVHNANALAVARYLSEHPHVDRVYYPGLADRPDAHIYAKQMKGGSGLLSFSPKNGAPAARKFLDRIEVFTHAVSLGGTESLAVVPAMTSHRSMKPESRDRLGIDEGLIRLSVGIEAEQDLIDDLARALG